MVRVGGEVDAFCTRCGLLLAHTVHAMVGPRPVRVECNTCHAVHAYRAPHGAPAAPTSRPRARAMSFDDLMRSKGAAHPAPYSPRTRYALDQVIEHPTFGTGLVTAVKDAGKVEVTFRNAVRTLVHGRGEVD